MTEAEPLKGEDLPPSSWVVRFLPGIAPRGRVLDVACGAGRHVRLVRRDCHRVTAVDINPLITRQFADDPGIEPVVADIEGPAGWPLAGRQFDAVVVVRYLHRPVLPDIVRAVAPTGILIYETFAVGQERFGRPTSPDHLLRTNELVEAARDLAIVAFEHGEIVRGDRRMVVQRIAAVGREHAWAGTAPRLLDRPSSDRPPQDRAMPDKGARTAP